MPENQVNNEERVRPHTKRFGREIAMQYLFSCEMQNVVPGADTFDNFFETICQEMNLTNGHLIRKGKELAVKLYQAVILRQDEIDNLIKPHCEHWSWERLSGVDRNILRIAVAEILEDTELPILIPINEAVEITRDFSGEACGRFVNGILNNMQDELKRLRQSDK